MKIRDKASDVLTENLSAKEEALKKADTLQKELQKKKEELEDQNKALLEKIETLEKRLAEERATHEKELSSLRGNLDSVTKDLEEERQKVKEAEEAREQLETEVTESEVASRHLRFSLNFLFNVSFNPIARREEESFSGVDETDWRTRETRGIGKESDIWSGEGG